MNDLSSVTRRQFLSGLFAVTAAGLLFRENIAAATLKPADKILRLNALIRVLQDHHKLHDAILRESQEANLVYAFEKINPSNHLEGAVAVACSMSYEPICHLVDEYVRRRNREKPRLPDYPEIDLKAWGIPDTYRMLIFHEQLHALLAELTEVNQEFSRRLCNNIMRRKITAHQFAALLKEKYRRFSGEEIKTIIDAVQFYGPTARPYTWCSAMVNRADAI